MSDSGDRGRVLVTGATGFIGQSLCHSLQEAKVPFRQAVRMQHRVIAGNASVVGIIDAGTDWTTALEGITSVIHLAARVHVMRESSADPLAAFRQINLEGTLNLARQAVAAGVKRFIYLSSIKVNGEETNNRPFHAEDKAAPADPYALSKLEAEEGLRGIADKTGLEVVVIRPPLVYGRGAGGNFSRLLMLVRKGWLLPFAAIKNKRSLVFVENLCDLIMVCLDHPGAAGQTLLVSDGQDISTPGLIRLLAKYSDRKPRLVPLPLLVLHLFGMLVGRSREVRRLTGSLHVDASVTRKLLDWQPPYTLEQGIERSVSEKEGAQKPVCRD